MDYIKGIDMPQEYVTRAAEEAAELKWWNSHKSLLLSLEINGLYRRSDNPEIAAKQASLLGHVYELQTTISNLIKEVNQTEVIALKALHAPIYAQARETKRALNQMINLIGAAENLLREADMEHSRKLNEYNKAVNSVPSPANYPDQSEYDAYDARVWKAEDKLKEADINLQSAKQHHQELLEEQVKRQGAFDRAKAAEAKYRSKLDFLEGKDPVAESSLTYSESLGLRA